jgi:hypothetical protein
MHVKYETNWSGYAQEDHYEKGCQEGFLDIDASYLNSRYSSIEELLCEAELSTGIFIHNFDYDYNTIYISYLGDEDLVEASVYEIADWKLNKKKLYHINYSVIVTKITVESYDLEEVLTK